MPAHDTEPRYRASPRAVDILRERLQQMGVAMSEPNARRLLETVLALEGPRLESQARIMLLASLESIRSTAEDALNALRGRPSEVPRRDYELSFPPAAEPAPTVSGARRKVPGSRPPARPVVEPSDPAPVDVSDEGPRPVFRRRRGR